MEYNLLIAVSLDKIPFNVWRLLFCSRLAFPLGIKQISLFHPFLTNHLSEPLIISVALLQTLLFLPTFHKVRFPQDWTCYSLCPSSAE